MVDDLLKSKPLRKSEKTRSLLKHPSICKDRQLDRLLEIYTDGRTDNQSAKPSAKFEKTKKLNYFSPQLVLVKKEHMKQNQTKL